MSNKYKRLEGLADAIKEGFKHTNRARVEMSPEEEMEKKVQEKAKELSPASDRDIKILRDKTKKSPKDPDPEFLNV